MEWRVVPLAAMVCGCVEQHPAWLAGTEDGSATDSGPGTSSTTDLTDATAGSGSTAETDSGSTGSGTTGAVGSTGGMGSTGGTGPGVTHRIFVTSTVHRADFGGFDQADTICQDLANTAGLGGTFIAVVGESGVTVNDRIDLQGPVVNMLGEEVAATEDALWNGVITASVAFDEDGLPATGLAWTGADVGGIGSSNDCQTWTATNGNGAVGDVTAVGPGWLRMGTNQCGLEGPLYCIEQ